MIPSWPHFAHQPHESAYPDLWRGLVGAWVPALGVQGLSLFDVSGYQQHGTLTNMSLPADWITDGGVPALNFDGTDAYVNCGTSTRWDFGTGNFALMTWFRTDTPAGARQILMAKYGVTDTTWQFILTYDQQNDATDRFSIYYVKPGPTFVGLQSGDNPITDTNWHHVVGQRVGDSFGIYLDGSLLISGNTDPSHGAMQVTTTELWLGRRVDSTAFDPLDGGMRLAAIYNRALTADEVKTLYYEPLAPFLPVPQRRRSGSLIAVQIARPSTDTTRDNWEEDDGTTTDIWDQIDETSADDSDFIRTQLTPTSDVYVTKLTSLTDPGVHTGHKLRYRYRKEAAGGDQIDLTVAIRQDYVNQSSQGTLIATVTHTNISGSDWITATLEPSEAEIANITDYTNLYVVLIANKP